MKNIVCLKWGDKYSPHYVNVLYNMCKRHCTVPFNFICLTENNYGINQEITIKRLPSLPIQGWWYKTYVFSKDLELNGDVLFLDLDLVIYDNIDKLWDYEFGSFVIIRDFTRHQSPQWKRFNSSVFKFKANEHYWVWDDFLKNYKNVVTKFHGDQDYLYSILNQNGVFWPDQWIRSYKWEMRNKNELTVINGKRNFNSIKQPTVLPDSCIAVFHGDPNPHIVKDPWVIENWK